MDVDFILPDPSYEEHSWILQEEHGPAAQPPLIATTRALTNQPSEPGGIPPAIIINGYTYRRADAGLPFGRMRPPHSVEDLVSWRREWPPQVDAIAQQLNGFEPERVARGAWNDTLSEQDGEFQRVYSGVHRSAVGPVRVAVDRFFEAYLRLYGEGRRSDAMEMLQGFPNLSLERASAVWDLSRVIRSDPTLSGLLGGSFGALAAHPSGGSLQERLDSVLQEFGYTTNNGMQDMPTWADDPTIPLAVARGYAALEDDRSPRRLAANHREQRLRLEEELKARANSDPSAAAVLPLMEMAQVFLPNLEDHNLLTDQRLTAASRARWLSIGGYLVQLNAASSPDDVFFYERQELVNTLEGGDAVNLAQLQQRRQLLRLYRAVQPPPTLGQPVEGVGEYASLQLEGQGPVALRGTPASSGTYRGRARIIESLNEADSLVQGDVLVVRSTTPPWSPYFGIVGAVITNSGGALSHGAIVAREFGIPAVVGLINATALIPDGATVTVDGATGVVVVERD